MMEILIIPTPIFGFLFGFLIWAMVITLLSLFAYLSKSESLTFDPKKMWVGFVACGLLASFVISLVKALS